MIFIVIPSRKVKKYLQKRRDSGRLDVIEAVEQVSNLLAVSNAPTQFVLREQWRDHALKGDKRGKRELHVGFDELLVYKVHEKAHVIELMEIMTHEELRKQS